MLPKQGSTRPHFCSTPANTALGPILPLIAQQSWAWRTNICSVMGSPLASTWDDELAKPAAGTQALVWVPLPWTAASSARVVARLPAQLSNSLVRYWAHSDCFNCFLSRKMTYFSCSSLTTTREGHCFIAAICEYLQSSQSSSVTAMKYLEQTLL